MITKIRVFSIKIMKNKRTFWHIVCTQNFTFSFFKIQNEVTFRNNQNIQSNATWYNYSVPQHFNRKKIITFLIQHIRLHITVNIRFKTDNIINITNNNNITNMPVLDNLFHIIKTSNSIFHLQCSKIRGQIK